MIVVSGATGNVGRPLVQALAAAGRKVTALSRNTPDVRADLARPASLRPALAGAEAFFLLVPGAGADLDVPAILDEVTSAGVKRIVLLSSQAAHTRPDSVSHAPLRAVERAVEQSGMEWTHLRPGGFTTNSFAWVPSVRGQRTVRRRSPRWACPRSTRWTSPRWPPRCSRSRATVAGPTR